MTGTAALLMSLQLEQGLSPDAEAVRAALINSAIPCDPNQVEEPERCLLGKINIAGAYELITGQKLSSLPSSITENAITSPILSGKYILDPQPIATGSFKIYKAVDATNPGVNLAIKVYQLNLLVNLEEQPATGNKTFFKLETGFDMNTGDNNSSSDTSVHGKKSDNKSFFGRQAHLGISNQSLGQLTIGRQNTVGYDTIKDFDPTNNLNQKGLIHYLSGYTDLKNNHNRSDGTIKYQHQLNRVTFLASYQSGNQVGSVKHGSSMAIGMKYRDFFGFYGCKTT